MTGRFTEKDPERCNHYARFMQHLNITQANCIFWGLFTIVLLMMCLSSFQHHRSNKLIDIERGLPAERVQSAEYKHTVYEQRKGYFGIVMLCFWISLCCVILECFAAFNIMFCDGEDLIQLYWGFWSVLQVGSLIAIVGVILQFWIVLSGVGTPPWGVALGTPVLVFAALVWILKYTFKGAWVKAREHYMWGGSGASDSDSSDDEDEKKGGQGTRHISRAETLVPESSVVVLSTKEDDTAAPQPGSSETLALKKTQTA